MADQTAPVVAASRSQQLASFIFDPLLPRSRYTQLIQLDGIVHSIVKRLLEKHQHDSHLRIEAIVSPTLPCPAQSREQRTGFQNATTFMMRLPTLKPSFSESADCLAGDHVVWPAFGGAGQAGRGGSRKRKRHAEVGLMEGVISGLEAIQVSSQSTHSPPPPDLLSSLCPPEARQLLNALYDPPPIPSSTVSKYLFIFAYSGGSSLLEDTNEQEWKPVIQTCSRAAEWDGMGWEEISSRCSDTGVNVSLVLSEDGEGDGPAKKRLKGFVNKVSTATTPPWFSLPSKTSTHLTSLSLPSSTNPFPFQSTESSANRSSPSGQANPVASLDSPSNPSQINPHQALAMRFLAQRNSASGSGGSPAGSLSNPGMSAALANFMAAARNGNVDPNDPQMAQFKQMIMLQQQMQGGLKDADIGPAQQRQKMIQAMQAMQAAQASQGGNKGLPQSGSSGSGSGSASKNTVWRGEIVWPVQNGTNGEARVSVECTAANNGTVAEISQMASALPRELRIVTSMQADSTFLQSFVREKKTPVLHFELSSESSNEPLLSKRFESLINGLSAKGTVGVVHVGTGDRGVLLCSAPSGPGQLPRLLGVLCMAVPLPTSPNTKQSGPTPTPSNSSRPPLNGPTDLPAPYKPPSQSYIPNQQNQPNTQQPIPNLNPNQPLPISNANTDQLRGLLAQAARMGIELPPDLDPTKLSQGQIRVLLQNIKVKNMQKQHLAMQQQQQQQQQGGQHSGGMPGGIDPRLMPGGNVDPRLIAGQAGEGGGNGNQLGLQQMQQQMQAAMSQSGGDGQGQGQGYMGNQYQDGR